MAILLNDNFKIAAAKPIDSRYGPYINVAAAKSAIPVAQRHPGLVVGIRDGGDVVEHWFKAGVTNDDLIPKTTSSNITSDWQVVSSNSSVLDNSWILADSSNAEFTITLIATPTIGDYVWIQDAKGTWQTNNVIVNPNGNQIVGLSDSLALNISNAIVLLTYVGGSIGWDVKNVAGDFSDYLSGLTGATGATGLTGATGQGLTASVKVLTANDTWTKPDGAKVVYMAVLAGGGSGQGGGMWDGTNAVASAAGGGGGGINEETYAATDLPASLSVVVGAGGSAVAGRTVAGAPVSGNPGTATSISSGGIIYAYASPGLGGGVAVNAGTYNGNNGATTTAVAGSGMRGGSGGGRGGGLTSAGTASNGTAGGDSMAGALLGGAVGTGRNAANGDPGNAGVGTGSNIPAFAASTGGGGGGTSAWVSGVGGAGGAGGGYGTGGGGGGAGKAGGGNSGPGAPGFAILITYF